MTKEKSKHRYSTYTLLFIFGISLLTGILAITESSDFDEVCNQDNSTFKRLSGLWQCKQTSLGELTITTDTTISIPNANTYYTINNMSIGHGRNIITDNNTYFQVLQEGYYKLEIATSFSGGGNTEYEIEVFINNQERPHCELHRKMSGGGDVGSASISCLELLNINDTVTVRVADNTNPSNDILIHSMNFNIVEII